MHWSIVFGISPQAAAQGRHTTTNSVFESDNSILLEMGVR